MAKKHNPFCSRNGGATIKGVFYPVDSVSAFLGRQLKRQAERLELRNNRRAARLARGQF